jgi:hypothetical protein
MTRLICILLTLLFSLSGPALGANIDFCRSSIAVETKTGAERAGSVIHF